VSEVPSPAALSPSPDERLQEALLARVRSAADRDFDAEIAALEAAGECEVPTPAELAGLAPDPLAGPPDGEWEWLADLPGPLRDEYLAATAEPAAPEALAAAFWDRSAGDGCGFAAGGVADELAPGPVLAGLAGDACTAGLGRLSDDELIGVLRAGRRLASWSASVELAAVSDLMRRRMAQEAAGCTGAAEHADAEIAAALALTGRAAGGLLDLAMALQRLPLTARALAAGGIDVPRAMVIADEVAGLGDDHVAAVEARVLARAADQTTTQVRAAARRAVIAADPGAVRRRRETAERQARVERWAEHAGTAALAGRDLPPAEALAADQHVAQLAAALRAAGVAGTMDQLRARVFVALLAGQPVSTLVPPGPAPAGTPDVLTDAAGGPPGGVTAAWTVNLTMPLSTWLGLSQSPGEVAGYGPLGAQDSQHLGKIMAAYPKTRWCLTIIGDSGRPVAHGCARARPGRRAGPGKGPGPPPGSVPWATGLAMEWLETGGCAHRREVAGYRPPAALEHLVRVRQQVCAFPGCQRAARRCDLDHTIPYDQGGRTCACNLAPLCRKHHRCKQAEGWRLEQPEPGVLVWRTPSGRTCTVTPTEYPA
jgi:hypothetical protein